MTLGRRLAVLGTIALVWWIGSVGPLSPAESARAQPSAPSPSEILFPGDPRFSELEAALEEKSGLKGSDWPAEFTKRETLGRVRSSNGIQGSLFPDSLALITVLTGQEPFLVYGTISIPAGARLGPQEFSGDYGIVIFLIGSPIIALIDSGSGSIGAFISVPNGVLATFPLFAPVRVFQILVSLIAVPAPASAPPPPPSAQASQGEPPACPEELTTKSELNAPLNTTTTIIRVQDDSGAESFEITTSPPRSLTVSSLGASVQFLYRTATQRRLGLIFGAGSQEVPVSANLSFTLLVSDGEKTVCIQATPKVVSGALTLVGTLYRD